MRLAKAAISKIFFAGIFFVLLVPAIAFASVTFTEMMYDAPAGDSGHEWIEIKTDSAVDLHGYKLFEGGVNHGISVVAGTSTLAAGEVAIITTNPQAFLLDFPHYTGTLFKSSFSLSNTGEEIVLKDASLASVSTFEYSSNVGAGGDGNSLHKKNGAWVAGAPSPGSLTVPAAIHAPAPAAKTSKSSVSKSSATKSKSSTNFSPAVSQSAAVGEAQIPAPRAPQNTALWTVLGLCALIVLGVGGVLYVRAAAPKEAIVETSPSAGEFEIE